jgi:hypothetical protein
MAGILDLIPEIGKLLDRFVPDPAKKLEAEQMMKELDIRELEARMGVQKAWLSNNSLFVAGAIPTVLWMVSIVIFFNHILAPLLEKWLTIPTLDLPEWYANLAATIVLGLFGKKAWDSSEIHWHGETIKPAKEKVAPPTNGRDCKAAAHAPEGLSGQGALPLDARFLEMCKEKGIEP